MPSWSDVVAVAAGLPGAEEATTYGSAPAIKVRKKIVCWYRDNPEALAMRVADLAEKEALLSGSPEVYFTTDHYDGYAYVLVRLELVPLDELAELIEDSWRISAPARVVAAFDAEQRTGAVGVAKRDGTKPDGTKTDEAAR